MVTHMTTFYRPVTCILIAALLFGNTVRAQVVINEIFVSPSTPSGSTTNSNSLYNTDPADLPAANREWIELYNTSICDTVDLSCYTLASNMQPPDGTGYANWGAFTFPAGTLMYPASFLVIGGNAAAVPVLHFNMTYYRSNGFGVQYLCGDPTRWFLRDEYGWLGLYTPTGAVEDAVYWDLYGIPGSLTTQPEYAHPVPATTTCSGAMSLPAAVNISGIEYAGKVLTSMNMSLQRISDGSSVWNSVAITPTPGNCNSDCIGPPEILSQIQSETCLGGDGSIALQVLGNTGPYTIEWQLPLSGAGANQLHLTAGTYIVKVTDASGCFTVFDTLTVDLLPGPTLDNAQVTQERCSAQNGSIALNTSGSNPPFTYQWNPAGANTATLTGLNEGHYAVTVTDQLGCTDTASFDIADFPGPLLMIDDTIDDLCSEYNGQILVSTLGGSAPITYVWNAGPSWSSEDLSGVSAGTYSLIATDANGCTATITANLSNTPPPEVSFINVNDETCHKSNGTATLVINGGHPPYLYSWDELPGFNGLTADMLSEGVWHVTVTDSLCTVNAAVEIHNIPGPLAGFRPYPEVTTLEFPRILFCDLSVGATRWNYDFGDACVDSVSNPYHEYKDTGTFRVLQVIHDDQGCMDSVSHTVLVLEPITLFVPNAFTPNGDGRNDVFQLFGQNICDLELCIYNRWGEQIFHATSLNDAWNGTKNGQPSPEGVYSWVLWYRDDYRLFQTNRKIRTGHVCLFR